MKILTWNVNGIRAVERKGELQNMLATYDPDMVLLQEIKGKAEQFSDFLVRHPAFDQFYHSAQKPGYAGTGVWVKKDLVADVAFHTDVPHAPNLDEGRVSHISFVHNKKTHDVLSIYFPNGGKSEQAWEEKLVFFDRVLDFMNALREKGHDVIVGGDMNVAHTEIDLARAKENDGNIGFHPKERAWMDRVMENGWKDVFRAQYPDKTDVYSWWDLITRARERNVGWRLDYFFIDHSRVADVKEIRYLSEQYGSDHCPLFMDITL